MEEECTAYLIDLSVSLWLVSDKKKWLKIRGKPLILIPYKKIIDAVE